MAKKATKPATKPATKKATKPACEWDVGDVLFHSERIFDKREITGIGTEGLTYRYYTLGYETFDERPNLLETVDSDDPWLSSANGWTRMIKNKTRWTKTRAEYSKLGPREQLEYLRNGG